MNSTGHLLRWKGRQIGPLPPAEIRARLARSEIGLMHEVQVDGQWITMERYLARNSPRPPASAEPRREAPPPAAPSSPAPPFPPPVAALPPGSGSAFLDEEVPESTAPPVPREVRAYAGFWLRGMAAALDTLLLAALTVLITMLALTVSSHGRASVPLWIWWAAPGLHALLGWLYHALMESSEVQATLGKLAAGLVVTDLAGERITFGHATGRQLGKLFSVGTIAAGFFMAAFTGRKQALHDLVSGCLVLLRLPPARLFQPPS